MAHAQDMIPKVNLGNLWSGAIQIWVSLTVWSRSWPSQIWGWPPNISPQSSQNSKGIEQHQNPENVRCYELPPYCHFNAARPQHIAGHIWGCSWAVMLDRNGSRRSSDSHSGCRRRRWLNWSSWGGSRCKGRRGGQHRSDEVCRVRYFEFSGLMLWGGAFVDVNYIFFGLMNITSAILEYVLGFLDGHGSSMFCLSQYLLKVILKIEFYGQIGVQVVAVINVPSDS